MASTSTSWGVESHGDAANLTVVQVDGDGVFEVVVLGQPDRSVKAGHDLKCSLSSAELPSPAESATLTYEVFIPTGFDWGLLGWKMPGLAGNASGTGSTLSGGGTLLPDSWSGRVQCQSSAQPSIYLYVPELDGVAHDTFGRGPKSDTAFNLGQWNTLSLTYVMNTPGVADGSFVGLVNGAGEFRSDEVMYRTADAPNLGVTHLWHHVYAGGSGNVGPTSSQTIQFRNHVVSGSFGSRIPS